jgi:hypothetical protein
MVPLQVCIVVAFCVNGRSCGRCVPPLLDLGTQHINLNVRSMQLINSGVQVL